MTMHRTWRTAFIVEPARLIAAQPAQVGISALSVLLTAIYFAAPLLTIAWLPQWLVLAVTSAAALGVEYAFLKGVADRAYVEAHGGHGVWGDILIYTTGGLLVMAGTTVLLTYAYAIPWLTHPPAWLAALLSLAHVAPLALIGVCSAQLHAAAERVQLTTQATLEDRRHQVDLEVYEAEQRALARARVRAATAADTSGDSVRDSVTNTVTPRHNADRDVLRAAVVTAYRDSATPPNVTHAAAELGISRAMWYKLKAEAEAKGEL